MEIWGEIKLKQLNAGNVVNILKEIQDPYFPSSAAQILNTWKNGNLYGLEVTEPEGFEKIYSNRRNPVFCNGSADYLLPCFCEIQDDILVTIWTHKRARNRGFASKLIAGLNLKKVWCQDADLESFYQKRGLEIIREVPEKVIPATNTVSNAVVADPDNATKSKYWKFKCNSQHEFETNDVPYQRKFQKNYLSCGLNIDVQGAFGRFNRIPGRSKGLELVRAHWKVFKNNDRWCPKYTPNICEGYFENHESVTLKFITDTTTWGEDDFVFTPCEEIKEVPQGYESQAVEGDDDNNESKKKKLNNDNDDNNNN